MHRGPEPPWRALASIDSERGWAWFWSEGRPGWPVSSCRIRVYRHDVSGCWGRAAEGRIHAPGNREERKAKRCPHCRFNVPGAWKGEDRRHESGHHRCQTAFNRGPDSIPMQFGILTSAYFLWSAADVGFEAGAAVHARRTGCGERCFGVRPGPGFCSVVGCVSGVPVLRAAVSPGSQPLSAPIG